MSELHASIEGDREIAFLLVERVLRGVTHERTRRHHLRRALLVLFHRIAHRPFDIPPDSTNNSAAHTETVTTIAAIIAIQ